MHGILGFILFIILMAGMLYLLQFLPMPSNPNPCELTCEELEFQYLKADNSGFGSGECWCVDKDGTPIQSY